jgi:hypothetical protein
LPARQNTCQEGGYQNPPTQAHNIKSRLGCTGKNCLCGGAQAPTTTANTACHVITRNETHLHACCNCSGSSSTQAHASNTPDNPQLSDTLDAHTCRHAGWQRAVHTRSTGLGSGQTSKCAMSTEECKTTTNKPWTRGLVTGQGAQREWLQANQGPVGSLLHNQPIMQQRGHALSQVSRCLPAGRLSSNHAAAASCCWPLKQHELSGACWPSSRWSQT